MLYPVLFTPIYKEMVWGGERLHTLYNRFLPYKYTGESWDISCRPPNGRSSGLSEMGLVENGPCAGITFAQWIECDRPGVLGTRFLLTERFPLLVKIIDAQDHLSIQVHPDDVYALAKNESDSGKNEIWYILEPPDEGYLIIGLQEGVTREILRNALETNEAETCFNRLFVKKGDIVNIPTGLVHALTRGAMVAEIQQNSDLTYRIYDYNRTGLDGKPRTLHIQDAFNVIDFENKIPKQTVTGDAIVHNEHCVQTQVIKNMYFTVIKYQINGVINELSDPEKFYIFTSVDGSFNIRSSKITVDLPLSRSAFIPAGLGAYEIQGNGILLKCFVT